MEMKRIYSANTGHFLGIIYRRGDVFVSETRKGIAQLHRTEEDAMARLEKQPEHWAEEAAA